MRKINKSIPKDGFNGSKYKGNCDTWEKFHKNYKSIYEELRINILTKEQNYLDGYTEIYIDENNICSCHIDHYKKKDLFPKLTFDLNNYIVATLDDEFGARYKDNKYKIRREEYAEIFDPIIDNIETFMYYNKWGGVEPKANLSAADKAKVEKTIEVFNLNHSSLKKRREALIKLLESYNDFSGSEIKEILKGQGFISVIEQEITD